MIITITMIVILLTMRKIMLIIILFNVDYIIKCDFIEINVDAFDHICLLKLDLKIVVF